jgi:hypothetical protein
MLEMIVAVEIGNARINGRELAETWTKCWVRKRSQVMCIPPSLVQADEPTANVASHAQSLHEM